MYVVALACVVPFATTASAQPLSVRADVDPCVIVDVSEFRRLLDIELGTSVQVELEADAQVRAATVTVRCSQDGIELHLQDSVTRKIMSRSLPASALASSDAPRLLALAVAEFVVSSWLELSLQPAPVEPIGPPPPREMQGMAQRTATQRVDPAQLMPADRSPGPQLAVVLSVTSWLAREHALWIGPGVRLTGFIQAPVMWVVGFDFGVGSTRVEQGLVDHTSGSAIAGLGLAGNADGWRGAVALGGRVGYARMAGLPDRDRQLEGLRDTVAVGGVLLWTTATLELTKGLEAGFEVEAGYATMPVEVRSGQMVAMALDNLWLRAAVLLAVQL